METVPAMQGRMDVVDGKFIFEVVAKAWRLSYTLFEKKAIIMTQSHLRIAADTQTLHNNSGQHGIYFVA